MRPIYLDIETRIAYSATCRPSTRAKRVILIQWVRE